MGDATFTFDVDEDLKQAFTDAAAAAACDSAAVLRAAMRIGNKGPPPMINGFETRSRRAGGMPRPAI